MNGVKTKEAVLGISLLFLSVALSIVTVITGKVVLVYIVLVLGVLSGGYLISMDKKYTQKLQQEGNYYTESGLK